jgi:hypothetical protein
MSDSNSNDNGRIFEAILTQDLATNFNAILDSKTTSNQVKDLARIENLSVKIKDEMYLAARHIVNWFMLKKNFKITKIIRLSDSDKSAADIQIYYSETEYIPISLKHNHQASKHPRPASLVSGWFSEPKNSPKDVFHRSEIAKVHTKLAKQAKGKKHFSDLSTAIIDTWYHEICLATDKSINDLCKNNPERTKTLFEFLVPQDLIKIMFLPNKKKIIIEDLFYLLKPRSLKTKIDKSHIKIYFDNNWILDARIHSASKRINLVKPSSQSSKFDVQIEASPVSQIEINLSQL